MKFSKTYRLAGRNLFKLNNEEGAYIHCAIVPARIESLKEAIDWYENQYTQE